MAKILFLLTYYLNIIASDFLLQRNTICIVVTTWIYGGSVIRPSQVTEILEKLTDVLGHEDFFGVCLGFSSCICHLGILMI